MRDHLLAMREAVVQHLLGNPGIAALVGDRVYGEEAPPTPEWPFIRYGLPIAANYETACWDGKEHSVTIHAFARGPGMDKCAELAAAIETAMSEDSGLPLDGLGLLGITSLSTQIIRDSDEESAYHAILQFTATTIETVEA